MGYQRGSQESYRYRLGQWYHHLHRCRLEPQVGHTRRAKLTDRAGADDKEEFMATMVDENDRTKTVGEMHNIQGWTKYITHAAN